MPSLSNSSAGQMSTMTWGQAKNQVAQVVGGAGDPETDLAAEAQITAVLQDWNTRRNWQFLQVQASNISVVGGTPTYVLPAAFKRPYSAILDSTTLAYVTRRRYNRVDAVQSASTPYYYTLYNEGSTGNIELIPSPVAAGTLKVWYYRLMTEGPTSDGEPLDVLARYANYVLDAARARLLGLRGPTEKLAFWMQQAESGFMKAQADDEHIPDEDVGFSPMTSLATVPSDNSFRWVDWGW